jgi:hypothetical protein
VKNSFLAVASGSPVGGAKGRGSLVGSTVNLGAASVGVGRIISVVGEAVLPAGVGCAGAVVLHALRGAARMNKATNKESLLFIVMILTFVLINMVL